MGQIEQLSIILLLATIIGFLSRFLKQPLVIAYLATGALLAYLGFFNPSTKETLVLFSDIGIMFLLFLVGLEINYQSLRLVGKTSLIIGIGQIIFTSMLGFVICSVLGFSYLSSLYISVALTFSSTIIIVKLLSDKKDLNSLYGKISVGFLLVQDAVAILVLIVLSGMKTGATDWSGIYVTLVKGLVVFGVMLWLGRKILPKIFDRIAHSQELLFLSSTAWVFAIVAIVKWMGLSIEIGGFLAGIALANSSESFQISYKIRPLRDFFILLFFLILGANTIDSGFAGLGKEVVYLSLFVLIGNPLIVLILMGMMGYKKRTSFFAGVTVAQISEFSLIVAAMGKNLGHISQRDVSIVTAVGVITIVISTYLIIHNQTIYQRLKFFLSFFEKQKTSEVADANNCFDKEILLIGFQRTGHGLARALPRKKLLVIDHDPEAIVKLDTLAISRIFGDITDSEILELIQSKSLKLIISTVPDFDDNRFMITSLKNSKNKAKVIVRADTEREAIILYKLGADYVLLPHLISGHRLGQVIKDNPGLSVFKKLKQKDLEYLQS